MENNAQKKIAVTGANGFIGTHCVVALLEAGFSVIAIVRDPSNPTKTKFLEEEASKLGKKELLSFSAGDLFKEGSYDDALEGTWGVVHTAAIVNLDSNTDPDLVVKPAVEGTKNVTASVKKHANTIQRFVNISSVAAVFSGDKPDGHVFVDEDWNEWGTPERGDTYGYAKTMAEKAVWDDADLISAVDTVVSVNPGVVLGKAFTKSHAVTSSTSFIYNVLAGNPIGNGPMPFVDARDVSKAIVLALTQDKEVVGGKRFILSSVTMDSLNLNAIVKKSHPEAKGAAGSVIMPLFKALTWLGEKLPFLRKPLGWKEIWKCHGNVYNFDGSKAETVLGIGKYRSIEDTCQVAADSLVQFLDEDETSK